MIVECAVRVGLALYDVGVSGGDGVGGDGGGVVVVLWSSVCEQGYNWPLLSRQKLDFMMG